MSATYRFVPWVRKGLATGYTRTDDIAQPTMSGSTSLNGSLTVSVNGQANAAPVNLQLLGPADVAGVDPRAIIRVEPSPRTAGFEPNYLPFVEFDDPDFPWLFTPAAADSQGRLRPWLCLVVVEQQEGVSLTRIGEGRLPVLSIRPPARPAEEVPDLSESWAWAHAQALGDVNMDVGKVLGSQPAQNLARLICPRRLAPRAQYFACLVPAFEAGRLSGLGQSVPAGELSTLHPAWDSGSAAPQELDLPVYYSWQFSTGAGGDFEELARSLTPQPLPKGVGVRQLRVGVAGFGLPDAGVMEFTGALRPPSDTSVEPAAPVVFGQALRPLLNLAGDPDGRAGHGEPPVVGPPIYGSRQAVHPMLPEEGQPPVWLAELNLNPAYRAAAGLGSLLIQDQQETLMASAWDQLGEARRAASLVNRLPFNEHVLNRLFTKLVAPLSPEQALQFAGPAQARVPMGQGTLVAAVRSTDLPEQFTAAAFRRVVRPGGPLMRRLTGTQGTSATGVRATLMATGTTTGDGSAQARAQATSSRIASTLASRAQQPHAEPASGPVTTASTAGRLQQVRDSGTLAPPQPGLDQRLMAQRFAAAAAELQAYYERVAVSRRPVQLTPFQNALPRDMLVAALDPRPAARERIMARLAITAEADSVRSTHTLLATTNTASGATGEESDATTLFDQLPSFPQPMSSTLSDLSQDFLLPGAGDILPNSVSLLETNPHFVEAFMVGLNHEMGRELLWREFPNDQRLTYFSNFWDTRGSTEQLDQLPPIHTWQADAPLGGHLPGAFGKDMLVLMIRGQLLLRYPTAIIYAVQAGATPGTLSTTQKQPLFRGPLDPDMTYLGFDLTLDAALGENGRQPWFFVIQEQPTAPRFGLDEVLPAQEGTPRPPTLDSWDDLTWSDVALGPGGHISLARQKPEVINNPQGWQWSFNSAHMAAILRQRPSRVAIPAALMLPQRRQTDAAQ